MYEIEVREVPARSLLTLLRHVSHREFAEASRDVMGRFADVTVPRLPGASGAPFIIYHGEAGPWPGPGSAATLPCRWPAGTVRHR